MSSQMSATGLLIAAIAVVISFGTFAAVPARANPAPAHWADIDFYLPVEGAVTWSAADLGSNFRIEPLYHRPIDDGVKWSISVYSRDPALLDADAVPRLAEAILGMNIDKAEAIAAVSGVEIRIVKPDDESISYDLNPFRINVVVEDTLIRRILSVG